jgi:hypothetical protein
MKMFFVKEDAIICDSESPEVATFDNQGSLMEFWRCTFSDVPSSIGLPKTIDALIRFPQNSPNVHGMCVHDDDKTKVPADNVLITLHNTNGDNLTWNDQYDEYVTLFIKQNIHRKTLGLYRAVDWVQVFFTKEINYSKPVENLMEEFTIPKCNQFCDDGEIKMRVVDGKLFFKTSTTQFEKTLDELKTSPHEFRHREFKMFVKVVQNYLPV